jgi:chromosome segregation ATPase
LKRRLSEERARNNTLKENYAELKSDLPVLEEEIRRLRRVNQKLKDKNEDLVSRSSELASELRESTPSSIFSKTEPTGRNAREIKARIQNIETPLKHQINNLETQISATKEDNRKLKLEVKRISSDNTSLKREKKRAKEQIKTLSEIVADLDELEKEKESSIENKSRLEEDIQIIKAMLTGVSSRQAEALQMNSKKKSYINKMRHSVGWMQEIINATLLAGCANIRQLGHDGGSI